MPGFGMVKRAQWQQSGFSCDKPYCNGSVQGQNQTRNRPCYLVLLLTLTRSNFKFLNHVHQVCVETYAVGFMDECSMTVIIQPDPL
jgi:hypothetical protein